MDNNDELWKNCFKGKYTLVLTNKITKVKKTFTGLETSDEAIELAQDESYTHNAEIRRTTREDFEQYLKITQVHYGKDN